MDSRRLLPRSTGPRFPALRSALAGLAVAMLLSGCNRAPQDDRVAALEQRLTAVEQRAEAAEKRARSAEEMARHAAPNPYVSNDAFPEPDPDVNQVTDPTSEDPQFQNGVAPPPAPVIPNG